MAVRAEFHELLLTRVRLLTEDSVGLTFLVPAELTQQYQFLPGQYLTLQARIDGQRLLRPYSIASGLDQPSRLEVGIRCVEGGRFSTYANRLSAGIMLKVMTPQGLFTASPATTPGVSRRMLIVAAGSGITPCLSIIKSLLASDPNASFTLILGNRTAKHVMFADDINALQHRYPERLAVINVLSRESTGSPLLEGHIDSQRLSGFVDAGLLPADGWHAAYCCGPPAMQDEVVPWLSAIGLAQENIHRELFVTPDQQPGEAVAGLHSTSVAATNSDTKSDNEEVPLTIHIDGVARRISVRGKSETLLAAATRQGIDLPYSCAGGLCSTCRCKLLAGEVSMDANYSLASWEVENGYILACQSRASDNSNDSDNDKNRIEIDFDAT